jgi:hypothetical protein
MSPRWASKPRRTDRLVVGRNVTLTLIHGWIESDLEGSGRSVICGTTSAFSWRNWKKSRKTSVRTVGVEIRTRYILNTSQNCHNLSHLVLWYLKEKALRNLQIVSSAHQRATVKEFQITGSGRWLPCIVSSSFLAQRRRRNSSSRVTHSDTWHGPFTCVSIGFVPHRFARNVHHTHARLSQTKLWSSNLGIISLAHTERVWRSECSVA